MPTPPPASPPDSSAPPPRTRAERWAPPVAVGLFVLVIMFAVNVSARPANTAIRALPADPIIAEYGWPRTHRLRIRQPTQTRHRGNTDMKDAARYYTYGQPPPAAPVDTARDSKDDFHLDALAVNILVALILALSGAALSQILVFQHVRTAGPPPTS